MVARNTKRSRFAAAFLCYVVAAAIAGCGRSSGKEVTGAVRFQGKPLASANVTFTGTPDASGVVPVGVAITDESGNFRLRSRSGANDVSGLPPGEYRVAISKVIPPDGMTEEEYQRKRDSEHALNESKGIRGASTLPPRVALLGPEYSDTQTSKLNATVTAKGPNQFVFDIP